MNLQYNSISLQGFKSFDSKQIFYFSNLEKGLYFVTGENQVEPQLGANGCLIGGTLIDTPRNLKEVPLGIPIKDLVDKDIFVYSYDCLQKRMVLKKAFDIRKTGEKQPVYKIKYSSKTYGIKNIFNEIILTAEHLVMKRDGSYCKAIDLQPNDRLMPFYRVIPDGYCKIDLNNGKRVYEHKFILSELQLPGDHGHHKDRNKINNSVTNLEGLSEHEHLKLHYNDKGQFNKMLHAVKNNHPKGMLGKTHTEETKHRQSINNSLRNNLLTKAKHKAAMNSIEVKEKLRKLRPRKVSKEILLEMYVDKKMCIEDAAKHLGIMSYTVSSALKYYGIKKRTYSEVQLNIQNAVTLTKEQLEDLYVTKQLFLKDISKMFNITPPTIRKWLEGYQIPKRNKKETMRLKSNHKVINVEFYGYEDVYDMEVEDTHNFVANGIVVHNSGKSTLLVDSISWILFGKTSTNLKAGNVKNWQSKELCEVVLDFNIDSDNYILRRTQSPNSLTLSKNSSEPKTVTDEEIVQLINLDFNSFLYSIVVSQFGSKFFDLRPAEKMDVFASVMEDSLACWMDYSDKAKAKKQEIETTIETNERDLSKNSGQIETLQSQDYSNQIDEFESKKIVDIALVTDQLQCKDADIFNLASELKKTQIALDVVITRLDSLTEHKKSIQLKLKDVDVEVKEVQEVVSNIRAELNLVNTQYQKLSKLEEGSCPTCQQPVSRDHTEKELKILQEKIDSFTQDKHEADELLLDVQKNYNSINAKIADEDRKIKDADKDKSKYEYDIRNINQDINRAESDKKSLISNKKAIEEKVNPYKELQVKSEQEIIKLQTKKKDIEIELKSFLEDKAIYEYWVKGFKDIRFMVLSEALAGLEIQMNNNLQKLGMEDWEIVLSVDSETKKGTTCKGFTVLVKSPTNKELVPFECWSGGEGQRLRLCGTYGLAQFILDRKGIVCNIEIADEPSQHLSELGVESLVNLLHDRGEDEDKKIFFIDHKGLENLGVFKSIVKVIKDKNGSRIEIGE